jgi:hypothetical protein
MSPVGFGPIISADERPQIYALDRAATGTGVEDEDVKFLLFVTKSISDNGVEAQN